MRRRDDAAGEILGQPVVVDNKAGGSGTAGPATMAGINLVAEQKLVLEQIGLARKD